MATRMQLMIRQLERALESLKRNADKEAVQPEDGAFYRTFNGSLVFVVGVDDDGDGRCVVLRGGHGVSSARGEKPGEGYLVSDEGYYQCSEPSILAGMGLLEKLEMELPEEFEMVEPTYFNRIHHRETNPNNSEDIPF